MNAERWAALRCLVEEAMELPGGERLAFVEGHATDAEMARDARELIELDTEASSIFEIAGWEQQSTGAGLPLANVGSYRLVEELGRGGMGVVYRAERDDGLYQQTVALKVLQESVFTPGLGERFRQERQILARLQHPGIARLLDGGVTEDARPYLVLEYVDGQEIDTFCESHELDVDARLKLFLRVAEAVQYAHQQLILHLDIKPANILVTKEGEPRLLDFGISRILAADGKTLQTLRILTPRYASPEQASDAPLGIASDVFSLGTLLYRLLAGVLPYPIDDATPFDVARMIMTEQPKAPSEAAPEGLKGRLRGDLDTILLQALRKEPERRYATVAAFAEDIERHLQSRPVLAHRDSFGYRTGKFFRRNRASVVAAGLVLLVIAGSVAAVARAAVVARRERATAERRLKDVTQIAHSYIFELSKELQDIPGTLEIRGQVVQRAFGYLEAMSKEKSPDLDLQHELAGGYYVIGLLQGDPSLASMGDQQAAEKSISKALEMQKKISAELPGDLKERGRVVMIENGLGDLLEGEGKISEAAKLHREAFETAQPIVAAGPKVPRFWDAIPAVWLESTAYSGDGDIWNYADPQQALPLLAQAQDLMDRWLAAHPEGDKDARTTALRISLYTSRGNTMRELGRDDEGGATYRQALALADKKPLLADRMSLENRRQIHLTLAQLLLDHGQRKEAVALAEILRPEEMTEKREAGADTRFKMTLAQSTAFLAMLDLTGGRTREGLSGMEQSFGVLREAAKRDPGVVEPAAILAHNLLEFAGLPQVEDGRRVAMLKEAEIIANDYARAHPEVLSAKLLVGQAELTWAKVEQYRNPMEAHQHAAAARAIFAEIAPQRPNYAAVRDWLANSEAILRATET